MVCSGPHCNGDDRAAVQLSRLGGKVKKMLGGSHGWHVEGFATSAAERGRGKWSPAQTSFEVPGPFILDKVRGGRTVYISGQIALDASGNLVGKGDLRAQTRQVFENLKIALAAAGATFKDVIKINTYCADSVDDTGIALILEVRSRYLNQQNPPAARL